MAEGMAVLIAALNESTQAVIEMASECPPGQAVIQPAAGQWSVRDILCHLADTELLIFRPRMEQLISADGEPEMKSIDHQRWENEHNYESKDLKSALMEFQNERVVTVAVLEAAPEGALTKAGIHDERGRMTLADVIQYTIDHTHIHEAQISRTMRAVAQLS